MKLWEGSAIAVYIKHLTCVRRHANNVICRQELLAGANLCCFVWQQRANKPTEYIRYEDEAHNAASWSLGNRRDYVEHTLAWLNFWLNLKNPPPN